MKPTRTVSQIALCVAGLYGAISTATAQTQPPTPPQPTASTATPDRIALNTAPAAPTQAAETGQDGLQDIIVTATRRETTLQRTPQAISVLNGAALQLQGRAGLEDLKVSVPNVNLAATSNTTQLYIRGIGNTFINAGGDPGVALYQDGSYISDQTTTNVNFFDIARVEVLRGPQGALYGRNATGGAINVITAKPLATLHGRLSATAGDYGRLDSEGFVTGPLGIASTDARLSFQTRHLSGYIRNVFAGGPNTPERLDDLDSQAVRLQTLTHLPGGELSIAFTHYRENDNGAALAVVPTPGFVYPAQALSGAVPSNDPRRITVDEGRNRTRVSNVNVNLDQSVGDGTLTLTGNYRDSKQFFDNDCDGTPVNNCSYLRDTSSKDYYGDLHFASAGDKPLRWLIGGTYLHFNQYQMNTVLWDAPSTYLGGPSASIPVSLDTLAGGRVKTDSFAFYTDLHLKLSDIWSLTGQARYSRTTKNARELLVIPTFALNVRDLPNRLRNASVPFKAGVEGQLTRAILVYGNYSTAFKDGAINLGALQTVPVRKEQVKSIEAGLKTTLLNRKLQLNAAAFHSIYTDLQISQLIGTVVALVNAPRAEINGAEVEIVAEPIVGLHLTASAGYLDPKLKQFSNARIFPGFVGPQLDLSGQQLPYVAKFTATLGVNYEFSVREGYTAAIGGNFAFQSRTYFNEFNDRDNSQGPVGRFDLSASIGPDGTSWKLFGFVRNVTNRTVLTGTTIYSPLLGAERAVSYAPPRHFGAGFSYSF